MENIISFIDEIIKQPQNILLEQAISKARIPIGYTCSYVPEVLLSVGKLIPVRMRAPGIVSSDIGDAYLSNVTCLTGLW